MSSARHRCELVDEGPEENEQADMNGLSNHASGLINLARAEVLSPLRKYTSDINGRVNLKEKIRNLTA